MTPYELSKMLHRDLSSFAPRLSTALNRALNEIGEGSTLVGMGKGTHVNDDVSFTESETINTGGDYASVLSRITAVLWVLEENSNWKVIIDKKPKTGPNKIELLYTLFRSQDA
jgi:hypothetical protein